MATMIVIRPGKSAKSICRLCFTEQEEYQPIGPLKEWIGKLTSMTINNVLNAPSSLCLECKATLEDFESFREMCFTNNRVFTETFIEQEHEIKSDPMAEPGEVSAQFEEYQGEISAQFEEYQGEISAQFEQYQGNTINWEQGRDPPLKKDVATQVSRLTKNKNSPLQCPTCGKFKKNPKLATMQSTSRVTSQKTTRVIPQRTTRVTLQRTPPPAPTEAQTVQATPPVTSQANNNNENNPTLYTCEQCGKQYAQRSKLNAHVAMHNKSFFCEYCGKGFPNNYYLKVHTRVHTGERPFPCDVCGKGFFSRFNLNQHKLNKHSGLSEYACKWCSMAFPSFTRLDRHQRAKICRVENKNKVVAST